MNDDVVCTSSKTIYMSDAEFIKALKLCLEGGYTISANDINKFFPKNNYNISTDNVKTITFFINWDFLTNYDDFLSSTGRSFIQNIQVFKDKEYRDKTVKVTFSNGASTVAVVKPPDVFNLTVGIRICILKFLLKNTGINKLTSISEKAAKAYLKGEYNNKNKKNINNKNIKEVNNG